MKIKDATDLTIMMVAQAMRESDRIEFSALRNTDSKDELGRQLAAAYGNMPDNVKCFCTDDGEPVAIAGLIEWRPNVLTLLFFATERFAEIGVEATKHLLKYVWPGVKEQGIHRVECVSIEGHADAHRWIKALGLVQEAPPMRGYGKNGESFLQFSWVDNAVCATGS